jgi:plastocyanin
MGGDHETEGEDNADGRGALQCTAWAGTGVLWGLSGGVPHSLSLVGDALAATPIDFAFLQNPGPAAVVAPPSVTIKIDTFTFGPDVQIPAGTTVTWTNGDDIPHRILAADRAFHSPPLDTGDSFSRTFAVPGTIEYVCGLQPHMTGRIVVTP